MMDRGPDQDWFGSPEIWIEAVVAALGFWVFLVQTLTAEHPFFHRDLAKDRNFVTCHDLRLLRRRACCSPPRRCCPR